jgi:hypothetical protein
MAEEYPFPRWEIYYVLIVFPGLVTSSAQIFLMEGVHCRLAGLAGLSFTGAILLAMFLFMCPCQESSPCVRIKSPLLLNTSRQSFEI